MANYTYLVNDIIEASENDGTEFVSYIPKMVNRVEERLTKTLDDYGLVTATSVSLPTNQNLLTLPAGTLIIKNIHIKDEGTKIALLQRTDEFINDYWPVSASTGTPKYYAMKGGGTGNTSSTSGSILLAPVPNSTYEYQIHYNVMPTKLEASSNETSYISLNFPNGLLYCCLAEAFGYLKGPMDMLQLYESKYKSEIQLFAAEQIGRRRRDDYTDGTVRIPIQSPPQ